MKKPRGFWFIILGISLTTKLGFLVAGCGFFDVQTPVAEAVAADSSTAVSAEPNYLRHTVKDIGGAEVALTAYAGDVVLVVNTASRCGFTGQLEELQELHESYSAKGLRVLGFPCNDFGGQEPGTEKEIASFCSAKYDVSFPLFSKVKAKSAPKHPLYTDLTERSPEGVRGEVKWNFTKFLIGRDGRIVARFGPAVSPTSSNVIEKIEGALSAAPSKAL